MAKKSLPPVKLTSVQMPSDKPPALLSRMIELLSDVNLSFTDIDRKMMSEFPILVEEGWCIGTTREKVKQYPILAKTATEARALIWRELGRSKIDGYRAISDALDAVKVDSDGEEREDHDIRMKASDRMLALMGESTSSSGAKTNIMIGGSGDNKIVIMSGDGRPIEGV